MYRVYMPQSIYLCVLLKSCIWIWREGARCPGSWGTEGKQDGDGLGYVPCPGAIKLIMPL